MTRQRSDVSLRPWQEGDLPLLRRLLGDPAMMVFLGGPESEEKLLERHARYLALEGSTDDRVFAVVIGAGACRDDKTGLDHGLGAAATEAVGWVGYWESAWDGDLVWEIGWHVLPEFQGQGIATAAARLAIELARRDGRHRFAHALPSKDNVASNAVCRSLGFVLGGAVDVEYPPGHTMHSNDWSLDLHREPPVAPARLDSP